jgi:hypothetical protein
MQAHLHKLLALLDVTSHPVWLLSRSIYGCGWPSSRWIRSWIRESRSLSESHGNQSIYLSPFSLSVHSCQKIGMMSLTLGAPSQFDYKKRKGVLNDPPHHISASRSHRKKFQRPPLPWPSWWMQNYLHSRLIFSLPFLNRSEFTRTLWWLFLYRKGLQNGTVLSTPIPHGDPKWRSQNISIISVKQVIYDNIHIRNAYSIWASMTHRIIIPTALPMFSAPGIQ